MKAGKQHLHERHVEGPSAVSFCRLTGILEKFPLPRGSAQGELVAAGIKQRCTLLEREVRPEQTPLQPFLGCQHPAVLTSC